MKSESLIFTIIPVKPFAESKTRLEPILSPEQRAALSRLLLRRTLAVALSLGPAVVVSRDPSARKLAKQAGAWAIVEHRPNLNAAITQGCRWAAGRGAAAAMILPLDLPLLTPANLQTLVRMGLAQNPAIVIAPCRHNRGTNALFLRPPALIAPRFGPDSFRAHRAAAEAAAIAPQIYRAPGLVFDLDTPADWQTLDLNLFDPASALQYNRNTTLK